MSTVHDKDFAREMAGQLLSIQAVKLSPKKPFTWSSGLKSPIYCDNRKTLSYPPIRNMISAKFVEITGARFERQPDVIAGVATGAIGHGAYVARDMIPERPLIYVREKPKAHGLGNQIEGCLEKGQTILVIEDLISTGKSSRNAVEALREAGAEVLGLGAIMTYGFTEAERTFREAQCDVFTLTDYDTVIDVAIERGLVDASQLATLVDWRRDPDNWKSPQ